jgi:hypothetical protein
MYPKSGEKSTRFDDSYILEAIPITLNARDHLRVQLVVRIGGRFAARVKTGQPLPFKFGDD